MIDFHATISVTGTDIELDGEDGASGYLIDRDGFGMVGRSWDRTTVGARGWQGEVLVDVRATNGVWQIPVRVVGSSHGQITTRRRALEAAVSQFAYTLTILQDGTTETWEALPADWQNGGELMLDTGQMCWQMTLTIPVYPIPGV